MDAKLEEDLEEGGEDWSEYVVELLRWINVRMRKLINNTGRLIIYNS